MCLLLLFAAAAMGWEIPPPPDLPPPPPPPPPNPSSSPQTSQCSHIQTPVLSLPGDAVLVALLELRTGIDCEIILTDAARQLAALAAVGSAISRQELVPQVRVGLTVLDTCSSPAVSRKALVSELVYLECDKSYPLGVLATRSTENAVASVTAGARQKFLRLPPPASSSNRENELWDSVLALLDSTWSTVSLLAAPSLDHHVEWLASVTREKGICLVNSSSTTRCDTRQRFFPKTCSAKTVFLARDHPGLEMNLQESGGLGPSIKNASESDVIIVIGALNDGLETLTLSAKKERRPGQPLLLVPLDAELSDSEVVADDALVLVPATENVLGLVEGRGRNNTDNIERVAAVAGLRLFLDVAKTVIRQIDGLAEVMRRKCKGKGICSDLPESIALPDPPIQTDEQILSLLKVRENHIEKSFPRNKFELRQGNNTIGLFMEGSWTLKRGLPIPDAYLICDPGDGRNKRSRDCSKCWNFQGTDSAAEAAIVDHTVHQVPVNDDQEDVSDSQSAHPIGPAIVDAPDSNLVIQWRHEEPWVAAVATVAAVGSTSAFVIAAFMIARIIKGDILEGNPCASFVLLLTVILAYAAVLPFCVIIPGSNRGQWRDVLCATRIFGMSIAYGQIFAVMLSRALMLASCDRDGGFLTHVSGYVQSSVYIALSTVPLWAVAAALMSGPATCASLSNGRLQALLLGYDLLLLVLLVASTPFIATSKRNYREGAFFSAAAALSVSVWAAWWALYLSLPSRWHDATAAGGLSGTATAVLLTVFIPRTYMMMTAVVRDRLSSALPSLAYSTGGSGLVGGPMYYDSTAEPAPIRRDPDEAGPGASGTFRNAYRSGSPAVRTPRALSPHDGTYERYESPNSPLKVTRF